MLLPRWLVPCTDWESKSHHFWEGCSPNEDYVAFLVCKLVEWYLDACGPAREGRTPRAGNDVVNDKAVENWVGKGVQNHC